MKAFLRLKQGIKKREIKYAEFQSAIAQGAGSNIGTTPQHLPVRDRFSVWPPANPGGLGGL